MRNTWIHLILLIWQTTELLGQPHQIQCIHCNGATGQQYFQHPSDCTKFVQCSPSGPVEKQCPAGTRWDQHLLTCNHANAIACVVGAYTFPGGKCQIPDGCFDISPNCAVNAFQCGTNTYVQGRCRKTCGLCGGTTAGCKDISPNCAANAFQCNTNTYVQGRCRKTCGLCGGLDAVKPGWCPPVRPDCPQGRQFVQAPNPCSYDAQCAGYDKCCFDTCLTHHTCKPPLYN